MRMLIVWALAMWGCGWRSPGAPPLDAGPDAVADAGPDAALAYQLPDGAVIDTVLDTVIASQDPEQCPTFAALTWEYHRDRVLPAPPSPRFTGAVLVIVPASGEYEYAENGISLALALFEGLRFRFTESSPAFGCMAIWVGHVDVLTPVQRRGVP